MVTMIFLLHNNRVHITLFNLKEKQKKISEGKRIKVKACTKPLLWDANYDRKDKDYTIYVRVVLNDVIFPQILSYIVPDALHFLPSSFSQVQL